VIMLLPAEQAVPRAQKTYQMLLGPASTSAPFASSGFGGSSCYGDRVQTDHCRVSRPFAWRCNLFCRFAVRKRPNCDQSAISASLASPPAQD
jgi:hypothetical protein